MVNKHVIGHGRILMAGLRMILVDKTPYYLFPRSVHILTFLLYQTHTHTHTHTHIAAFTSGQSFRFLPLIVFSVKPISCPSLVWTGGFMGAPKSRQTRALSARLIELLSMDDYFTHAIDMIRVPTASFSFLG